VNLEKCLETNSHLHSLMRTSGWETSGGKARVYVGHGVVHFVFNDSPEKDFLLKVQKHFRIFKDIEFWVSGLESNHFIMNFPPYKGGRETGMLFALLVEAFIESPQRS
jgi:hypothetical protein